MTGSSLFCTTNNKVKYNKIIPVFHSDKRREKFVSHKYFFHLLLFSKKYIIFTLINCVHSLCLFRMWFDFRWSQSMSKTHWMWRFRDCMNWNTKQAHTGEQYKQKKIIPIRIINCMFPFRWCFFFFRFFWRLNGEQINIL